MQAVNIVAKNTIILYIRLLITMFVSLYSTRLVLEALGATDFGIFSLVAGMIAMLTFLNAAMTSASQRFMSFAHGEGDSQKQKTIFNVSIRLHLFIGLILIIVLEIAGYFFFNGILKIESNRIDTAKFVYHFMVLSTFFTVISVPYDAVINARENMLFVAVLGVIEAILKLSIAFIITYTLYDKLLVYSLLMACLALIILIIRFIYCRVKYQEAKIILGNYYKVPLFKEMTSFAGWSFLGYSSGMLAYYGQGLVLNHFFGTKVNAAQGVAVQIRGQLGVFSSVLMKALNPMLAKSEGSGNRDLLLKATISGAKISSLLLVIFYVPVLIELPAILNFWLTIVPEYTIIFCRILLCYTLIEQMFIPLETAIAAEGNIKRYQQISSIIHFIPIFFAFIFFVLNKEPYFLYISFFAGVLLRSTNTLFFAKLRLSQSILKYLYDVVFKVLVVFILGVLITKFSTYFILSNFVRVLSVVALSLCLFMFNAYFIGLNKIEKQKLLEFKKIILKKIKK
jgi:O-antigen/teichoic acid export membrane protein